MPREEERGSVGLSEPGKAPAVDFARKLRRESTRAEGCLWRHLRDRQLGRCKIRRQQALGPYLVDFVCFERRLVVELGGGQHGSSEAYDRVRDDWLRSQGYRVLRFWNNDVLENMVGVLATIEAALRDAG
jgi:very-short-patch-repair endonuclease